VYREVDKMPRCANCGILMPAGERRFEHHGVTLLTCSERCERVYDTYRFPRYEAEIRAVEEAGETAPRLGYPEQG
jgi:ribosomal protein L24E